MKPRKHVKWLGSSKADLKAFPKAVTAQAGYELYLVQCGQEPTDWKPCRPLDRECTRFAFGMHREAYMASRPEAIYVLHCFQKKTRKTSRG
jgi:phage-related protein